MGAPLARLRAVQARIGLQTLLERLPTLRVQPGDERDFVNNVGAPSRLRLRASWQQPQPVENVRVRSEPSATTPRGS